LWKKNQQHMQNILQNYHVYKHYKGFVYFNDTYSLLFIALFDDFNLITSIVHCLCPSFYLYLSNRWRFNTVKNTMLIYVHSFRLCQPLLSGLVAKKLCFSRTGFVYVKNWKNRWLGECQFCTNRFVFLPFWCYTKHPHVKYFDYVLLFFFTTYSLMTFFFLFINLQVEHTL
jgi:hypothetical protein